LWYNPSIATAGYGGKRKLESKKADDNAANRAEDLIDTLRSIILEDRGLNDNISNFQQIADHLRVLLKNGGLLDQGLAGPDQFLSIDKIEFLLLQLRKESKAIDLEAYNKALNRLKDERALILKKKSEYQDQGVRLRIYRDFETTLVSLGGKFHFARKALAPSTKADAERLRELGHKGAYVFPVDEYLGVSRLPFKMTVGTMLTIAKEAIRCESFEEAQKILKERSDIDVNDDTIRLVTNTIGSLVYNNDLKAVDDLFALYDSGQLILPEPELDHVFYMEVDGAMVATRAEDNKGSIYKENKLGLIFSSDHLRWRTDKHGKKKHEVLQREYTAHVGDCETFSKLMFEMACRNGFGKYLHTVLIYDGATWIRNMKNMYFPNAQLILDCYHLNEHVSDYFKIRYNKDESKYIQATNDIMQLFKVSYTKEALNQLKNTFVKSHAEALDKLLHYIKNNEDNIDYAKYRAKGYFIGSGAIESSNKTVLQRRLKYGATRWKISSCQSLVTLVAKWRSNMWLKAVEQPVCEHYGYSNHYRVSGEYTALGEWS
jgi:hypothetical protein